ncbi:MAG TPA: IPT/TIG domain-containing protein [Bacteroidia bacterium]|nr:IPT/TIG domain-containing protein [Bacteroidia bacterium]
MKKKKTVFIVFAITMTMNAFAQSLPEIISMLPLKAQRGDALTFTGKNFPGKKEITVLLDGEPCGNPFLVKSDSTTFYYVVPEKAGPGIYNVRVKFNVPDTLILPVTFGSVTIFGSSGDVKPEITATHPVFNYPTRSAYSFEVIGSGFSLHGPDNKLILKDRGEVQVCWNKDSTCSTDSTGRNMVRGEVISSHELKFSNIARKKYSGTMEIQIRVGHLESEKKIVTLSKFPQRMPLVFSVLGVLVIMALLYFINKSNKKSEIIAGRSYNFMMQVLIDKETDTISISRFQFMIWTFIAVFSYLYLLLSRSLIQGHIELIDIPDGLPALILISASTTVISAGITNAKGSKGSGSIHPTWRNLITNGGVIAPERIQLLVWTIVGAISFIILVVIRKPEQIIDLPEVPSGFLQLMGVSAAGYLGGKIARKPGPIIDSIESEVLDRDSPTPKKLKLTIYGHNLADEATFLIGTEKIEPANIEDKTPEIKEKENDKPEDAHLAKTLIVTFINAKKEWLQKKNELTLINKDGQKSSWEYTIDPPIPDPPKD